jgi:hypothetical protein
MSGQILTVNAGIYPGTAKAELLHVNQQAYLLKATRIFSGQASVAVQIERGNRGFYPWGLAAQVEFSGVPGTFDIEIAGSEDDRDASYVNLVKISAVNSSNIGRADLGVSLWPKFVRANVVTLTNDVLTTFLLTR